MRDLWKHAADEEELLHVLHYEVIVSRHSLMQWQFRSTFHDYLASQIHMFRYNLRIVKICFLFDNEDIRLLDCQGSQRCVMLRAIDAMCQHISQSSLTPQ